MLQNIPVGGPWFINESYSKIPLVHGIFFIFKLYTLENKTSNSLIQFHHNASNTTNRAKVALHLHGQTHPFPKREPLLLPGWWVLSQTHKSRFNLKLTEIVMKMSTVPSQGRNLEVQAREEGGMLSKSGAVQFYAQLQIMLWWYLSLSTVWWTISIFLASQWHISPRLLLQPLLCWIVAKYLREPLLFLFLPDSLFLVFL